MARLEREIIDCGKLLFERRLISGWGGNLSCRAGRDRYLITGQHAPLGFLARSDLVRLDGEGVAVQKSRKPSSETPMHLAIYTATDARAIVHAHPPMVLAFSLTHESFVPLSFEEKYTIGDVPIIAQETPTVTEPRRIVEELKYRPVVILKGHGTVAIGKNLQEAFLLTDLLEQAVHCQFFQERLRAAPVAANGAAAERRLGPETSTERYELFSREHLQALVDRANEDRQFRTAGAETGLTTSLTLYLDEANDAWTVEFVDGAISKLEHGGDGEFLISGRAEWWSAVFSNRIDPFLATQQGKLKLRRGELAQLSRWYKPFQRAFTLWQTVPLR
jgi:L-fuculose-phosphate aldolase